MNKNEIKGYLLAFATILIWASTYVFKKHLLVDLSPLEILFFRFLMAFILSCIAYPKFNFKFNFNEEKAFLLTGLVGVTLYYALENIALKYTQASNFGFIVSSIPILTAIIAHFIHNDEKFHKNLIYGFFFSIIGIFLIIFNGKFVLNLNPIGDFLAVCAAFSFAVYSNLLKRINSEMHTIAFIRKIFMYGVITMLPVIFITKTPINIIKIAEPLILINLIFLALFASIVATIFWNTSIKLIGVNKTSSFIYLIPMITMLNSYLFLNEQISILMLVGGFLILFGVAFSKKKENKVSKHFN